MFDLAVFVVVVVEFSQLVDFEKQAVLGAKAAVYLCTQGICNNAMRRLSESRGV